MIQLNKSQLFFLFILDDSSTSSTGIIAGSVVAGFMVILLAAGLGYYIAKKYKERRQRDGNQGDTVSTIYHDIDPDLR